MIRKLLLLGVFAAIGCSGSSNSVQQGTSGKGDLEPFYCDDIAQLDDVDDFDQHYALTSILSYEVVNRCLCIKYEYSGCQEAERLLVYKRREVQNRIPEVNMQLAVRNAGLCEQLFTDSACFSMKQMQLAGNEVLIYINDEQHNVLLDFNTLPEQN